MAIPLSAVLDPDDASLDKEGALSSELFRRAYYEHNGPFSRVIERLKTGFSVLVYLPGNCMAAAAELVKISLSGEWKDYCEHPAAGESIVDKWRGSTALAICWRKLIEKSSDQPQPEEPLANPHSAIFHNLDFLTDWHGGIYPNTDAQTAVACLIGGIRTSVVLGLSDRHAPSLPDALSGAFNEIERIDEIPFANFHRIIPRDLAEWLVNKNEEIPEGTVWLLASRLRWTDPLRAFRIMQKISGNCKTLPTILEAILSATQTVNFLAPAEVYAGNEPQGFQDATIEFLKNSIIGPFNRWKTFTGNKEDCLNLVRRLPPGLILYGPPGTGKTLLAKWIAREIGLPVRIVSGSEIRGPMWGEAEKNVRNLFRDARRASPCVIILDDADDLLPDRNKSQGGLASAERAVVNEFLQQLQGMHGSLDGVLVILTTNRFDDLDRAAIGRLALHIRVPYPSAGKISEIVDTLADSYNFDLKKIREDLIERFGRSIKPGVGQDPLTADSNYFSPREMQQAMRLLERWDVSYQANQRYTPTEEDLKRMLSYYE